MKITTVSDLLSSLSKAASEGFPTTEDKPNYRKVVKFDNGYGASIICNGMSYGGDRGLFEIAVINAETEHLCYDSGLTTDVIGYCDFAEVVDVLDKIKNLPRK